jgi:hypothetical protein
MILAYYQDFMEGHAPCHHGGQFCDAAKTAWRAGKTSGKLERYGQSVLA